MPIKKTPHFLTIEDDGRCKVLTPLPDQTLRGEKVSSGIRVKCGKPGFLPRAYPAGTVFGTTTLKRAHKGMSSFYTAKDLYLLSAEDTSVDMFTSPIRDELLKEYQEFQLKFRK